MPHDPLKVNEPSDFTFGSPEVIECPYPFYEALRKEVPIYRDPATGDFYVSRYKDCVWATNHPELLSNEDVDDVRDQIYEAVLKDAYAKANSVVASDPPSHAIKRAFVGRGFTPAKLREYEAFIRTATERLVDGFIDRHEVEFMHEYATPIPMIVIGKMAGLPSEMTPTFVRWLEGFEAGGTRYHTGERLRTLQQRAIEMQTYLRQLVEDRYKHPADDFLSELIKVQVDRDGFFDLPYLLAEARSLFVGGNATTVHMMGNTMLLLVQNPDQMDEVRQNPTLVKRVIEESLRVESPAQWLPRVALDDVEIAGVTIPKGSRVLLMFASANRDDSVFGCPEQFDIQRANLRDHLAFGRGIHFCLGAPLARLEGQIAFTTLLTRLKNIRLAEDPKHIDSVLFRAPERLQLRFEPA